MGCYETVENKIGAFFDRLGHQVAAHPWKIIIVVILVNGLLGIGMLKLETDIDVSRVYTPMNSQAVKDESTIKNSFPDKSGSDFYSYQLVIEGQSCTVLFQPYSGNILDIDFLDEVRRLDSLIRNISVIQNENIRYIQICAQRSNSCVVAGNLFLKDEFRQAVVNQNVTYPTFILPSGEVTEYSSLVYGVRQANQTLLNATHLKLEYYLRSDTNEFIQSVQDWQEKFVEVLKTFQSNKFDFTFSHSNSLDEELNSNIAGDISLFSVTFTLMITYACCATYSARHDCIGNRMLLGFAGVLSAGLSIVAAFGLVSACGMSFVSIVGNVPFLIIGIGVDDMFILLSGLSDALYDGDTRSRIGQMLRTSGVAITITSLTDVLAFGAGASSTFKGVRNFCVYTGVAVVFCYLNQTFLFSACTAVNESRVNSKRHFICCKKSKSKVEMKDNGASKLKIFCCAGTPPKSRKDVEGFPEKLVKNYLSKFVLFKAVKIIIILLFSCYLGISIWGAINLKQGLNIKDLVSEDSYLYRYQTWEDNYFPSSLPISYVIGKNYQYSDPQIQLSVENLIAESHKDQFISPNMFISWLQEYKSSTFYHQNDTETDFIYGLKSFLNDSRYRRFSNDVVFADNSIKASRLYVFTVFIDSSQDKGKMMENVRAIASHSQLSVTAFSPAFIFYEQYLAILPQTLQTLGAGVAAVFVITAVFMPHPLLLLYVVITMAMIMVGIIGFMNFWNLTLSSVTMIHLIMSVGFSVDFTAHICHAYMVAEGSCRNERVSEAMTLSGGPIFNGAVSSVLGILMLGFAKSYIFRSFFQVMLLVILFGAAHALFFLPVILSLVGPFKTRNQNYNKKKDPLKHESALSNVTEGVV